eukprot:TRINITY_DN19504_c0_g1_i1.p1 TRINITY_DN19504_c0_g1~~TRINITY_DN19504_c0_g1_i1.p1  ORF type:complete len:332 (+),score=46.13 TRINITY_DN19504_c0_g1_i1:77-997(+)
MCETSQGMELTRVSIVNQDEEVLYDQFVKPSNPIINYLTRFSGITEDTLADVNHTLKDVQNDLKQFITTNTIIIGHSLENDFIALKMFHDKVVDTSLLYPRETSNSKNSLRFLAAHHLNLTIQQEEHDSVQDAIAALRLTKLKLERGPTYGMPNTKDENIFSVLRANNKISAYVDIPSFCTKYGGAADLIPVQDDNEACEKIVSQAKRMEVQFILGRFTGLEEDQESSLPINQIQQLDQQIKQIDEALPNNSLFIVFSGHGREKFKVKSLLNQRKENPSAWSEQMSTILTDTVILAREGLCFCRIK